MICSDNAELIEPLRHSRWVGMNKDTWQREKATYQWYYEILDIGYKYNMNDLMASIGLVQLEKLPAMNQRRIEIIARYKEGLKDCKGIDPAIPYDLNQICYWMYAIKVDHRDDFIAAMQRKDIATGVHYMPLTLHPYFKPYENHTPVAYEVWEKLVTIPLHIDLTNEEVDYVIDAIKAYCKEQ